MQNREDSVPQFCKNFLKIKGKIAFILSISLAFTAVTKQMEYLKIEEPRAQTTSGDVSRAWKHLFHRYVDRDLEKKSHKI